MTIADTARAAAMNLEVKKDGLTQQQSGEWVLKLKVNAEDMATQLMTAPMGTRYVAALVEIGDNEEPVTKAEKPKGGRLAKKAGIHCNEPLFWRFLEHIDSTYWDKACEIFPDSGPDAAAKFIHFYCAVDSRAELDHDEPAASAFDYLIGKYEAWKRCIEPAA